VHRPAIDQAEHRRVRSHADGLARIEPAGQDREALVVHADRAGLAALRVEDADGTTLDVQIDRTDLERLVDADTGTVEHGDQRAVAEAGGGDRWTRLDERAHFFGCEHFRGIAALGLRSPNLAGGIRPWRGGNA